MDGGGGGLVMDVKGAMAIGALMGLTFGIWTMGRTPIPPPPQTATEVVASKEGKARLTLSFSPRVAANTAIFTFRAELHGEEQERYYCPEIEWEWTDGTRSLYGQDCPPWEDHEEEDYQRLWVQRKLLGPGDHVVIVRLLKNGRVLLKADAEPRVLAGE